MQSGYIESFNSRKHDELHTERPHSSMGYATLAAYAETLSATGPDAELSDGSASAPVVQPTPQGVSTAKA